MIFYFEAEFEEWRLYPGCGLSNVYMDFKANQQLQINQIREVGSDGSPQLFLEPWSWHLKIVPWETPVMNIQALCICRPFCYSTLSYYEVVVQLGRTGVCFFMLAIYIAWSCIYSYQKIVATKLFVIQYKFVYGSLNSPFLGCSNWRNPLNFSGFRTLERMEGLHWRHWSRSWTFSRTTSLKLYMSKFPLLRCWIDPQWPHQFEWWMVGS